ncbi:MAG: hypothetical protein QOF14_4509 [Hyphomicrobiales bacterium]|nr:hypothetical protein [Hyphomicrobiales bacterium]
MGDATAAGEPGATRQERIDFLKQAMAFSEGNVRAYDIKAQISLAAFVLSGNPLMAAINGACGPSARHVLVIALVVFIVTILAYLWVLWPVAPPLQKLTDGVGAKNLFYLHDPLGTSAAQYAERLKGLVVEPELTAEAVKLSCIRKIKAQRFKNALIVTVVAYLVLAAAFFAVGRCAF